MAGGDDQNPPFRGDDNDGFSNPNSANNPPLVGPLSGGFEFLFGAGGSPGSTCTNNVWNAFFLNSNGNITFDGGDTSNIAQRAGFQIRTAKDSAGLDGPESGCSSSGSSEHSRCSPWDLPT